MKYGTKKNQGCNLGKNCPDFHPKMCPTSIAKLECFDPKCNLCHVKGTKRKREQNLKMSNQDTTSRKSNHKNVSSAENAKSKDSAETQSSSIKSSESNLSSEKEASVRSSFLDQISLLKKEIQEAMDMKISSIFSLNQFHQNPCKDKQPWSLEGMNQSILPQTTVSVPMFNPQMVQSANHYQTNYAQVPQNVMQPYMVTPHQSMVYQYPLNHSQVPILNQRL